MGSRLLRLGGLLAAASLVLVGCAGGGDVGQSEPPLTLPPPESESPAATLDLESMTDDELLAEAERAYQGWLDDVASMRASGSSDYLSLDSWSTPAFRAETQLIMDSNIPEGHELKNSPAIIWIELSQQQPKPDSEVYANVCVDNTKLQEFDANGNPVDRREFSQVGHGTLRLALSDRADRLLVMAEMKIEDGADRQCSLES